VQETESKLTGFKNKDQLEFHLIGRLQKNKVRKAIKIYDVIQTVDTFALADRIDRIAKEENKIQRVYLQTNTGNDPNKQGFPPEELIETIEAISKLSHISVEGIMMIPPFVKMNDNYRKIYSDTRKLRDKAIKTGLKNCKNLSMGMTRDYALAVEEGATHIRIGTALFGERPV
jgi:hypothetical protein